MHRSTHRRLRGALGLAVAAALAVTGLTMTAAPANAANAKPQTIPALQEWTGGTGSYTFSSATKIVYNAANPALAQVSQTFADDLKALTGFTINTLAGTSAPAPGDIYLTLGNTDAALGAEGYTMTVTDRVTISAGTDTGAFYGTRSVLQLLHQSLSIPQGSARDWTVKAERGLMVDNGRKFFTVAWLRDHVKELAYLKMNYFHLHLADNLGFRIESTKHPEYVSADHLTKQEITDLIALAAKYKVDIIPEFDAPGHMDTILAAHPELKLRSNTGAVNNGFIDLSLDASYALIKDIYDEYLPLFPSKYFHIGADEYVGDYSAYPQMQTYARAHYGATATGRDTYYGFMNWANNIIRAAGKTTRMWNDGVRNDSLVVPASNIVIEFWYNYGLSPQAHVDSGHLISNESWNPTYYVLGGSKPNPTWGYDTWTPDLFQGNQALNAASRSKNLGSKVHVWSDSPGAETETQVAGGIRDILRVVAQQTWGSPKLVSTYVAFQPVMAAIGRNPAWPLSTQPGNLAFGKSVTVSSNEVANLPGANAVDGDYGTRWASNYTNGEWITVDLGTSVAINRVKLNWEAAYGKGYQIQTSADGTTWTTIYATTTGDGGIDDLTGLSGTGRYIRMQGTARGTSWGYSLYEFEVYAADLAFAKPTTASSVESGTAFNANLATDGNAATRWSSNYSNTQWLMVDLGTPRSINRVKLGWEAAYGRGYQIQTSNDGTTWTTIYTTTTGDGGVDDLTGLTGTGRFIRMNGTARGTGYGYSLWSFEVFGS